MLIRHRDNAVLTLTLNRPERHNAFDEHLIAALQQALDEAAADPQLRAVILTGNGPTFCAGADAAWMARQVHASPEDNRADAHTLARLMRTLDDLPIPTIAAVRGASFGGGVGLVACCDIAIATDTALFALSEVRLGLLPAVISPFVIAAIGQRQARRWFTTGQRFDATTALRIGLVHEVVPAHDLAAAVQAQLEWLHQAAPQASRQAKILIRDVLQLDDVTQREVHTVEQIATLRSGAEGQEGLNAFLEKRPACWTVTP